MTSLRIGRAELSQTILFQSRAPRQCSSTAQLYGSDFFEFLLYLHGIGRYFTSSRLNISACHLFCESGFLGDFLWSN